MTNPSALPPSLPQEARADRPNVWQAALLFVAFSLLAGGSCVGSEASSVWAVLFVVTAPVAAGAFALLVFRLWRRRLAEAWPSVGQALLMALAGGVLAVGGCGGWAVTMDTSALAAFSFTLGAVFVAGLVLAVGAGELFLVALARLMVAPRK